MVIKNVIIINDFNYVQGGASKVALMTARLLNDKNINVYFFSAVNKKEENIEGVKYITTKQPESLSDKNKIRGFINGIYNFKAKKELLKLLKQFNPENTIVHVHGWTKALSSSIFSVLFRSKFKFVLTLHEYFTICPNGALFDFKKNRVCNKKCGSIKCTLCNCDSRNYFFKIYRVLRSFVQNNVIGLNRKLKYAIGISDMSINLIKPYLNKNTSITKIYNPIEYELNVKDYKVSEKRKYFLYVGRLDKEKGVDDFCKVITDLKLKGIVIGTGKELSNLKLSYPNIDFKGWLNSNSVKEYMINANALIVPSIWYESAGLTILEAQFLNVPCIVSKYCSYKEFVKFGCSYDDIDKLKEVILNREYNKTKELNFSQFSKERYIENILKYYDYILE